MKGALRTEDKKWKTSGNAMIKSTSPIPVQHVERFGGFVKRHHVARA
jgi:hypothetical protein